MNMIPEHALRQEFMPSGPCPAQVMVVGEAPGEREVVAKLPFVGPSGFELDKMMLEAGLDRGQAFVTNVCRIRPLANDIENFMALKVKDRGPQHELVNGKWVGPEIRAGLDLLMAELDLCRPTIVLAFGNLALWAFTGKWGVKKWRGSVLQGTAPSGHKFKVIPTYHPAAVLRQYELRNTVVHDLRRAKAEMSKGPIVISPDYRFIIRPSYNTARYFLEHLHDLADGGPLKLAVDIETRAGHTACIGIAWSARDAICIPLMCLERTDGFWTAEEEAVLTHSIYKLLTRPNVEVVGQNFLYDAQYFFRHHHYIPNLRRDTMIAQHTFFSVGQKGLDYLASMYCEHYEYWKDEGKEWDTSMPEDDYWAYNCKDAVVTWEVDDEQQKALASMAAGWPKLPEVQAFQQRLFWPVLRTMNRGIRSDQKARGRMGEKLMNALNKRQAYIDNVLGRPLNIRSHPQMTDLFYRELNQKEIRNRSKPGSGKPGGLTCDDEALELLASREPMLRPLIKQIQDMRSMGVFLSTFVNMPLDRDGRIRCQFKVTGTISYRFASSENAFGTGGNLQNIPVGDGDDEADDSLPNIRELFLPDEGRTFFDIDLDSADLRVVTGESGCRGMQAYFDAGAKPYVEIAKEYFHDPSITKRHPSYKTMKSLCHGTNYLGEASGLASRTGLLVHEVDRVQKWYFQKNPEIHTWQQDLIAQIQGRRYIENVFGYRCYFFGRIEKATFREGVAWMPQSTVGCLINRAYVNIDENLPWAEILLQVHDSLAGQFPTHMGEQAVRAIVEQASVPLPYETPLLIPVGVKTSTESWGACG